MAAVPGISDLIEEEDSISSFLNSDYDLVDLESDVIEGVCPAEFFSLCPPAQASTWKTSGKDQFLLVSLVSEVPKIASSADIKSYLGREYSLTTVRSCQALGRYLGELQQGKTLLLPVAAFMGRMTWTRPCIDEEGAVPVREKPWKESRGTDSQPMQEQHRAEWCTTCFQKYRFVRA